MPDLTSLGISIWPVVKIFFLVGLGVYIVFALVVVKQVNLMNKTLDVGFELPISILAIAHLLFAIGVFILAIVIL